MTRSREREPETGFRMLLLDDDEVDRIAVRRAATQGLPEAQLTEVTTVERALAALDAGRIDCVLADYLLAGDNALDLLFQLEERYGDGAPPVVILTGKGNEPVAVEAMKRGVADYLVKRELSPALLRRSIRAVLDKRRFEVAAREQHLELLYFTTMAANDLRDPLQAMILESERFERELAATADPACRAWRRTVQRRATYMMSLLDGMLAYSLVQPDRLRFRPVEMKGVVEDVLETLAVEIAAAAARIEVGALPTVHGDRPRLIQVIQNLTTNALKFAGGAPPCIRFSGIEEDDCWRIAVADRGVGIDPMFHEQIFLPLRRFRPLGGVDACGLGLAICRRIVEQHGGRIGVSSTPGEGATFTFTIAKPALRTG
jgi:signal transduction histidine kinase